jgi:hypothetical protein
MFLLSRLSLHQGMDKLHSWPNMLLNFRDMLAKVKKEIPLPSTPIPSDGNAPLCLVRMLTRNQNTQNYTSIEANFLFAAMHIACMRDLCFSTDAYPDLPDSFCSLPRG